VAGAEEEIAHAHAVSPMRSAACGSSARPAPAPATSMCAAIRRRRLQRGVGVPALEV
jgi:hypothetical protein